MLALGSDNDCLLGESSWSEVAARREKAILCSTHFEARQECGLDMSGDLLLLQCHPRGAIFLTMPAFVGCRRADVNVNMVTRKAKKARKLRPPLRRG